MDDVFVKYYDLPTSIPAYVITCPDGSHTILINSRMSHERQQLSYQHELYHIKNGDCEKRNKVGLIELFAHEINY